MKQHLSKIPKLIKNKFLFFIIVVSSFCVLSTLILSFLQTFSAYDNPPAVTDEGDNVSIQAGLTIYVAGDTGNDNNNGSSRNTAKKTIASAITLAPPNPTNPTRIYIKEGRYQEWLTINAKHKIELYGGFNGTESDSSQRFGGETVVDGGKLSRCLAVENSNNIRLDKLTLRNGRNQI